MPHKGRGHFDFGLFIIDRKTDIAAFVALLISLFNLSVAGFWLLREPDPILRYPYAVTFLSDKFTDDIKQPKYLKAASDMLYLNKGEKGLDAILIRETLELWIKGSSIYTEKNPIKLISNKYEIHHTNGSKLTRDKIKDAYPITIPGRNVVSHYTLFVPYPIDCELETSGSSCNTRKHYVDVVGFSKELKNNQSKASAGNNKYTSVIVNLTAEFLDQNPATITCELRMQNYGINYLVSACTK